MEILTPEEKQIRIELKEKRKKEAFQKRFNVAYEEALKEPSLPEFRIKDGILLIKRISDKKLQEYKKIWLKELKKQVKEYTFEMLCEEWNGPFSVSIRDYNPHDLVIQYFYHKHGVDLTWPKINYQIVDKF
jgi:hypothetical protein